MRLKNFLTILSVLIFVSACSLEDNSENISVKYNTVIDDDFSYADTSIWQSANWSNGDPFFNTWCTGQNDFSTGDLTINLEQLATYCNDSNNTLASGEYRTLSTYKYGRYTVRMKTSDVNGTISSMFTYTGFS